MHGAFAEIETAAVALQTHLQFVESDRMCVDSLRLARGLQRWSALDHQPAQRRFIAQNEIVDEKDAGKGIRTKTHPDGEPSALHVLVEVEEQQKRSGILADEIKLGRNAASGQIARNRLAAKGSGKSELLYLVAAFRKSQFGPGDDLFVISAQNAGFDIEFDLLDWACLIALPAVAWRGTIVRGRVENQRFQERPCVDRVSPHDHLRCLAGFNRVDLHIVAGRQLHLGKFRRDKREARAKLHITPDLNGPGVDNDLIEQGPSVVDGECEGDLSRPSRRLRTSWNLDRGTAQIELDPRLRVISADGSSNFSANRSAHAWDGAKTLPRADRIVQGQANRSFGELAWQMLDVDRSRCAEHGALPTRS